MFPISVWRVVLAEFVVYIFTYLGINVSIDDENVVFLETTNEGRYLVIEGEKVQEEPNEYQYSET